MGYYIVFVYGPVYSIKFKEHPVLGLAKVIDENSTWSIGFPSRTWKSEATSLF